MTKKEYNKWVLGREVGKEKGGRERIREEKKGEEEARVGTKGRKEEREERKRERGNKGKGK